jgi:hypothetical protein
MMLFLLNDYLNVIAYSGGLIPACLLNDAEYFSYLLKLFDGEVIW